MSLLPISKWNNRRQREREGKREQDIIYNIAERERDGRYII